MLVSLDISHNVGWASKGSDGLITFGTRIFSAYENRPIMAGRRFRAWVDEFLDTYKPDTLVTERPFFRNQNVSILLFGLSWEAQRSAEERGIEHFDYAPRSLKSFLVGNGSAKKAEMVRAARLRGYNVENDHEADAIAALLLHEKVMLKRIDEPPPSLF